MFCLLSKYRSGRWFCSGLGSRPRSWLTHSWRQRFCVFASTGVDYSDSSMLEARSALETLCNFMEAAQAYMKGQMLTAPVQEAVLWERSGPPAKSRIFSYSQGCPVTPPPLCICSLQAGWGEVQRAEVSGRWLRHAESRQCSDGSGLSWKLSAPTHCYGNNRHGLDNWWIQESGLILGLFLVINHSLGIWVSSKAAGGPWQQMKANL